MLQKGSLPLTGQIIFDFDESQIRLITRNLVSKITISAIISFPDKPETAKKKIEVTIVKAQDPAKINSESILKKAESNFLPPETLHGVCRAQGYLFDNIISKNCWLLFGFLEGPKQIPITIVFYTTIKIGVYSFKKPEETGKEFGMSLN
jgi:hypothetical protein